MLGVILGSGFSELINHFDMVESVSYEEILGNKIDNLPGHDRKLYLCNYQNHDFVMLSGKLHFYEGFSEEECIKPLAYAIKKYGLKKIIVTSASGALSNNIEIGNWYNLDSILSFPNIKVSCGNQYNLVSLLKNGYTYNYHQGPSLGTISEYKMLNKLGIDFVGMSMLHEAKYLNKLNLTAEYITLPVCNYGMKYEEPSFEEVISIASKGVSMLSGRIKSILQ